MWGLGTVAFWLAAGAVLVAGSIAGWLKERDKERERQATLRTMMELEAAGKLTPETLAYVRERTAADPKGGRMELEKERERQTTLRAMLELEAAGKLTPETLAYMRERDAAERKHALQISGMGVSGRSAAAVAFAGAVGLFAFLGGLITVGEAKTAREPWPLPILLLLGIWAGGLLVAWLILRFNFDKGRKNDAPPAA